MSLLLPLALLGLLTVPVILLLHLLRHRRKQVAISSLRLWRDLQQRKHGALPRFIPFSLMLLLQLIIAIGLTLALARPASSYLLDQPEQTIFILDMTTSMAGIDVPQSGPANEPGQRFDVARQMIKDYVQVMDENDSFAVINLTRRPALLMSGNAEQKTSALLALDNLKPGGVGLNLPAALTLANGLVDPNQANQIVILTDGNYTVEAQTLPAVLAPIDWRIIPAQSTASSNQALLDVSSRPLPNGRHRIFARLVNYSDTPVVRTLRLYVDDAPAGEDTIEVEAQADTASVWTLPAQTETVALEIVEPDSLLLDNRAELPLLGATRRRILLLSDTPEPLVKALEAQPGVELTVRSANFTAYEPADFNLIVFDGLSPEQTEWPRSNVLVVNPPLGHSLLPADNFVRNLRPDPDSASPLLAGIDLSGVFFKRTPRLSAPEWAEIDLETMGDENEQSWPLIFHGNVDGSRVVVWGFDLNASNLPARLALPLLTANTLSTLLAPSPLASVPVGEPVLLAGNYSVELPDGHRLVLDAGPAAGSNSVFSRTKLPGLYQIYNENGTLVAGFAVHAGSPLESNLTQQFQPETLASIDAAALPAPDLETAFEEFWPLLAALALVVVTFEGWLAWHR